MRDPDVRLSDEERATFAALEGRLTTPIADGRWPRARRWMRWNLPAVSGVVAALIGVLAMVVGLIAQVPTVGAAGFLLVVRGTARATRRMTWAWMAVRWRRFARGPRDEHMWEP